MTVQTLLFMSKDDFCRMPTEYSGRRYQQNVHGQICIKTCNFMAVYWNLYPLLISLIVATVKPVYFGHPISKPYRYKVNGYQSLHSIIIVGHLFIAATILQSVLSDYSDSHTFTLQLYIQWTDTLQAGLQVTASHGRQIGKADRFTSDSHL